ncbi:tetratricopeptide repeat protein [bacterium]|nr:tetratricopeptide repeat protein [bacterium]
MLKYFLNSFFLVIIFSLTLFAQVSDQQKLSLAENFFSAKRFADAANLYLELYTKHPENLVYYNRLKESLVASENLQPLLDVITEALKISPKDIVLNGELADIFFKMERRDDADKIWDKIIRENLKTELAYRTVSILKISNNLFEEGIETIKLGREKMQNPKLLSLELANFLLAKLDYTRAMDEFLLFIGDDANLYQTVQFQIFKIPNTEETIQIVNKKAKEFPNNKAVLEIQASFLFRAKKYGEALKVYAKLDDFNQANGVFIAGFGNDLLQEKEFKISKEAFEIALSKTKNQKQRLEILFKIATCKEGSGEFQDTVLKEKTTKGAISDYLEIVANGNFFQNEASFRLGSIYLEKFYNSQKALEFLLPLLKNQNQQVYFSTLLKVGESYLLQNQLEKAKALYKNAVFTQNEPQNKQNLILKLAELEFFTGNFDSVKVLINRGVSLGLQLDFANDLIGIGLILNSKDTQNLQLFAQAKLLARQRSFEPAQEIFKKIEASGDEQLVGNSIWENAQSLKVQEKFVEAIKELENLQAKLPENSFASKSQFEIGKIYEENLKDNQKAISSYEKVLTDYGTSLFVAEARKRLRKLAGV